MTQASLDFNPMLPADNMTRDEVRWRLLEALRDGRIDGELRGVVLGYCAAMKRGTGPSPKQEQICRTLVKECRRVSWEENGSLVDWVSE